MRIMEKTRVMQQKQTPIKYACTTQSQGDFIARHRIKHSRNCIALQPHLADMSNEQLTDVHITPETF